MEIFDKNYDRLMAMRKAAIIAEGVQRDVWSNTSTDYLAKHWNKIMLARHLADRIERKELRGY